jgi:hypothetical protein
MLEWDAEEGERNLKALPYFIDWFEGGEGSCSSWQVIVLRMRLPQVIQPSSMDLSALPIALCDSR